MPLPVNDIGVTIRNFKAVRLADEPHRLVCECIGCGTEIILLNYSFREGRTERSCPSCGREPGRASGGKHGYWTVEGEVSGINRYHCRCKCGRTSVVQASGLRDGRSLRCKTCSYALGRKGGGRPVDATTVTPEAVRAVVERNETDGYTKYRLKQIRKQGAAWWKGGYRGWDLTPAQIKALDQCEVEPQPYPGDPEVTADEPLPPRPTTRGECLNGPRPCPWVSCRHNLYLDIDGKGNIKLNFPDKEPHEMTESCSLDVGGRGRGMDLVAVSELVNITRERVRQIEVMGMRLMRGDDTLVEAMTDEPDHSGAR